MNARLLRSAMALTALATLAVGSGAGMRWAMAMQEAAELLTAVAPS